MPTYEITAPDGRKFEVTGPNKEGALAALKAQLAQETQAAQTEAPDTSLSGAVQYGFNQAQSMAGKGIQSAGELTGSETLQSVGQAMDEKNQAEADALNYQRPENADGIIKNLREGDIGGAGKSLLYSAAEAAPQVGVGVGTSIAAGAAMAGAPVVGGTLAAGGTLLGINQALGANRAEKEDKGLDPTATVTDLSTAIASGVIELTPLKGGGATLRVLREGAQEMGQEGLIIGGTAVQGGEYVPEEIVTRVAEAGIVGATISKGVNTTISTVNKAGETVFRTKAELDPETGQAAGDVARMMDEIAKSEGYNLRNVDPSSKKGAEATLAAARSRVMADIDQNMLVLRGEILKNADAETKARFKQTLRQATNKISNTVTKENLDFVKQKVGGTYEGRSLLNALRKSNVITEVYSSGLKGGISQFTDNFNPLPRFGRGYTPAGLLTGNINMGAAAATGGQTLAIQIPAVVGGRAIDAVTGRRSKVNTFIRKNRKKEGLADPTGPRVEGRAEQLRAIAKQQAEAEKQEARDAKEAAKQEARDAKEAAKEAAKLAAAARKQEAADQKEAAKQQADAKKEAEQKEKDESYVAQYNQGLFPNPKSPRGKVYAGINEVNPNLMKGMRASQIDQMISDVLNQQEARFQKLGGADADIMLRAIAEYRKMLTTGSMGKTGGPLTTVIGLVKDGVIGMKAPKPQQGPQGPQGPQGGSPRSPQVQDGIDSNNAFLDNLGARIDEASASTVDKATLRQAIGDMRLNLGSDTVKTLKSIISKAKGNLKDKKLADQYLKPYLDRVEMQQAARKAKANKKKPKGKQNEPKQTTPPQEGPDSPSVGQGGSVAPAFPQTPPENPKKPQPKKPSEPEVKKNEPEAKALVEIGRVGTKYENGIQDVDQALEVAKLLGITVRMMNSGNAIKTATGEDNAKGVFESDYDMKGYGGTAFAIKVGGTFKGKKETNLTSLRTLLHEMAHGMTLGDMDAKSRRGLSEYMQNPMSNDSREGIGSKNSYISSVLKPIIEAKGTDPRKNPLIAEIIAVQESADVFVQNNPSETASVRPYRNYLEAMSNAYTSLTTNEAVGNVAAVAAYKRQLKILEGRRKKFKRYMEEGAELAVDPLWVYMMNPKLAKDLMPLNSKMIREEFKKANNGKIQFYSHPLATILAVTMGMGMLAALGLEEPDEEVMPDGILTA
jgi:hypothetical protein